MVQESAVHEGLQKAPTGIIGFDEITRGGLPVGRASLVVGGPGSGKTLFAMQFLVNGAQLYGEPGAFFTFEETEGELAQNVSSLGIDLKSLQADQMLAVDHVKVEAAEVIETGEYDLEGLFIRLSYAIDSVGAKRVVLDTIESIFSSFSNTLVLRSELRRLFRFLKDKGVTVLITGEKGDGILTRNGLEEYVSDAVIVLDNRVVGNVSTRRMRIIKYRGSSHGSNEYPFMIDENGFSVLPITSLGLNVNATDERISTGIPDLDNMMGGKGYFRASSIMVTGQAGTGKTIFGAEFVRAACTNGRRALYVTFEESASQIICNMRSVGIDLEVFMNENLLKIQAERPTSSGLETHLVNIHKLVNSFRPDVVVVDPVSSLMIAGEEYEVRSTLIRLVDYLKMKGITSLFTDLAHAYDPRKDSMISSLVDTWVVLESIESNGEMNRVLRLVKSRGMAHSNQLMEFHITDDGVKILPPYIGSAGVVTGSARYAQELRDRAEEASMDEEIVRLKGSIEGRRRVHDAKLEALKAELEGETDELVRRITEMNRLKELREVSKGRMRAMRSTSRKAEHDG